MRDPIEVATPVGELDLEPIRDWRARLHGRIDNEQLVDPEWHIDAAWHTGELLDEVERLRGRVAELTAAPRWSDLAHGLHVVLRGRSPADPDRDPKNLYAELILETHRLGDVLTEATARNAELEAALEATRDLGGTTITAAARDTAELDGALRVLTRAAETHCAVCWSGSQGEVEDTKDLLERAATAARVALGDLTIITAADRSEDDTAQLVPVPPPADPWRVPDDEPDPRPVQLVHPAGEVL